MGRPKKKVNKVEIDKPNYVLKKAEIELMRINEVATFFNVTERTVYLWIDHGHLKAIKTPGGGLRVLKESVDNCKLLNARK